MPISWVSFTEIQKGRCWLEGLLKRTDLLSGLTSDLFSRSSHMIMVQGHMVVPMVTSWCIVTRLIKVESSISYSRGLKIANIDNKPVRPSVGPSVRLSETRFFQWADYGRKWSKMTRKTVQILLTRGKVFQIVTKCPNLSQNVHFRHIVVQMDLFISFSILKASLLSLHFRLS